MGIRERLLATGKPQSARKIRRSWDKSIGEDGYGRNNCWDNLPAQETEGPCGAYPGGDGGGGGLHQDICLEAGEGFAYAFTGDGDCPGLEAEDIRGLVEVRERANGGGMSEENICSRCKGKHFCSGDKCLECKEPLDWVGGLETVKQNIDPSRHYGDKITVFYIDLRALIDQVEFLQSELEAIKGKN